VHLDLTLQGTVDTFDATNFTNRLGACLSFAPARITLDIRAASVLIGRIRDWEEATHRTSFPPALDPTDLERWEEPSGDQTQPGDFHLHDQPITFGEREFHSRPIRHRHPGEHS
jgi:hypothetical protein